MTKRMTNVVILEAVRWGARDALTRESMVGAWEVPGVVLMSVRGEEEDAAELVEELGVRGRAFPFGGLN
jgi:hypothetical protein